MQRKTESGCQLLARLISRTDLSSVDPLVFGIAPSSTNAEYSANFGKIIELYGSEGVGKSQLALHYVAKVCLPHQWKGHYLNGKNAKVVFIDTEYNFSVLQLAIIIEQLILQQRSKTTLEGKPSLGTNIDSTIKIDNSLNNQSAQSPLIDQANMDCLISKKTQTELASKDMSDSSWTSEDVEEIVEDSLSRLQVFKVSSSQELHVTLFSLNMTLANDPMISLVVIDTISAFYWIDKTLYSDKTELRMMPIANILSKQVSEFGITYLTIKSALIGHKRKWVTDADIISNKGVSSVTKDSAPFEHVEFLGRSWSKLTIQRIILSSKTQNGKKAIVASCSDWSHDRILTFVDDLLQF